MSDGMDRIWFDGACGMCMASVRRMEMLVRGRGFVFEPFPADEDVPDELKLQTRDCNTLGGADAILYIARRIWWAWPMWAIAQVPGVMPLLRAMYRVLARNRYQISGDCSIDRAPRCTVFLWILTSFVAGAWLYHGLVSKLFMIHPRHLLIVIAIQLSRTVLRVRADAVARQTL